MFSFNLVEITPGQVVNHRVAGLVYGKVVSIASLKDSLTPIAVSWPGVSQHRHESPADLLVITEPDGSTPNAVTREEVRDLILEKATLARDLGLTARQMYRLFMSTNMPREALLAAMAVIPMTTGTMVGGSYVPGFLDELNELVADGSLTLREMQFIMQGPFPLEPEQDEDGEGDDDSEYPTVVVTISLPFPAGGTMQQLGELLKDVGNTVVQQAPENVTIEVGHSSAFASVKINDSNPLAREVGMLPVIVSGDELGRKASKAFGAVIKHAEKVIKEQGL